MRYLDELVMGDDLRKVKTCKECNEEIEHQEGRATCGCKRSKNEEAGRKDSEEAD